MAIVASVLRKVDSINTTDERIDITAMVQTVRDVFGSGMINDAGYNVCVLSLPYVLTDNYIHKIQNVITNSTKR